MYKRFTVLGLALLFFNSLSGQFIEDDYVKPTDTLRTKRSSQPKKTPQVAEKPAANRGAKFFYGGDLSFQFGNLTSFSIGGTLGYKFSPELRLGFDLTYQYARNNRFTPPYIFNVRGGRIFGEYILNPNLFPHVEYEILDFKITQDNRLLLNRIFTAFLAGAGYNLPITDLFSIQFIALYNLNWNEDRSIYASPWVTRVNVRYNF